MSPVYRFDTRCLMQFEATSEHQSSKPVRLGFGQPAVASADGLSRPMRIATDAASSIADPRDVSITTCLLSLQDPSLVQLHAPWYL